MQKYIICWNEVSYNEVRLDEEQEAKIDKYLAEHEEATVLEAVDHLFIEDDDFNDAFWDCNDCVDTDGFQFDNVLELDEDMRVIKEHYEW